VDGSVIDPLHVERFVGVRHGFAKTGSFGKAHRKLPIKMSSLRHATKRVSVAPWRTELQSNAQ